MSNFWGAVHPTKDANVLCNGVTGNGMVGTSGDASCVNLAQAQVFNKIWYGMMADGSVPDPAVGNGRNVTLSGMQKWYGLPRGTSLYMTASPGSRGLADPRGPFGVAMDQVALSLQDPSISDPPFVNPLGTGAGAWKTLTYAQLSNALDQGGALQSQFADINTDDPDLTAFKNRGGRCFIIMARTMK